MIQLAECLRKLASDDEADRIYAAEDLGYANEAGGVQPLLDRVSMEQSRAVREAIAGALAEIEHEAVMPGILAWLDSDDAFLRNQGVEILRRRAAQAMPYLEQAFRGGTPDRRKFVIDVLARLTDPGATEIYRLALRDSDLNVVIAAVETLGEARNKVFRPTIESLMTAGGHPMLLCACLESLAQIGEVASVEVVRARLGRGAGLPGYIRPAYLKLLGTAGNLEDVPEITGLADVPGLDAPVLNALTALRHRYPEMVLPPALAGLLKDLIARGEPSLLGYHAVRLLSALEEGHGFPVLRECLNNSEKPIRIGAIQALREIGSEEARAAVREFLVLETDDEVLQASGVRGAE